MKEIERRGLKRPAYCRGCDKKMYVGEDVISTYSIRNRGQHIYFCLDCGKLIGDLSKDIILTTQPFLFKNNCDMCNVSDRICDCHK